MTDASLLDLLAIGEAVVDLLPPGPGPLEQVDTFRRTSGGAPANVATGVARLGRSCAFIGTVGDDPFGRFLQQRLSEEGISTAGLRRVAGTRTSMAFVQLDATGQPRFFSPNTVAAAGVALGHADLARAPVQRARIVTLGTCSLVTKSSREAVWEALDRARAAGAWIVADPNLRPHVWEDPGELRDAAGGLLERAHVLKVSSDECAALAGTPDPVEASQRLIHRGPRFVLVTAGSRGCAWALRRPDGQIELGQVPSVPATVIDTTGAGDAFCARLIAGLSVWIEHGIDPLQVPTAAISGLVARACAAGARVCEFLGAVDGLERVDVAAHDLALIPRRAHG